MMQAASMLDDASQSLVKECVCLCTEETRVRGVKGYAKHAKREANTPLKERHYHPHESDDIRFMNVKMKAEGLPTGGGIYNGIGAMYNICTDPNLGLAKAVVRQIPCACTGCNEQLDLPWQAGVPVEQQLRYKASESCKWKKIFHGGLNNWTILTLVPGSNADDDEI
jgi:hypothetical protein